MLHAVPGVLVGDGRVVLDEPAPVVGLRAPGDPQQAITLQHLMEIRDGLDFKEDYEDAATSDVMQMLFGDGQVDMAAHAADSCWSGWAGTMPSRRRTRGAGGPR